MNANDDLEALAELVPELRSRKNGSPTDGHTMTMDESPVVVATLDEDDAKMPATSIKTKSVGGGADEEGVEVEVEVEETKEEEAESPPTNMLPSQYTTKGKDKNKEAAAIEQVDSMQVQQSEEDTGTDTNNASQLEPLGDIGLAAAACKSDGASLPSTNDESKPLKDGKFDNEDQNLGGFDDVDSENALNSEDDDPLGDNIKGVHAGKESEKYSRVISSSASLSTATQTHEVRMPMYLPTFKPATGCTNASDFIVRCFVARLRSGITVVKHGRSRWCKSRLRILHIHPDGRSLSWKPAVGEPNSSKRPPKLDLSTCKEVRHAWSPDPLNPMFTGTPILRQKCEAANAHKSFALIFPKRTVDITAVTADQCKVLMEGFSALCFRLQVANLAGRGSKKGKDARVDDEEVATTASVTLTNNSTQLSPSGSGAGGRRSKRQ